MQIRGDVYRVSQCKQCLSNRSQDMAWESTGFLSFHHHLIRNSAETSWSTWRQCFVIDGACPINCSLLDIHPSKTTSPDICVHASPNPPSPLDKYIIYHVVFRGYFHGMTHVLGTTLVYYLELFDVPLETLRTHHLTKQLLNFQIFSPLSTRALPGASCNRGNTVYHIRWTGASWYTVPIHMKFSKNDFILTWIERTTLEDLNTKASRRGWLTTI